MYKFLNLTPHAIVVQFPDGSRQSFPPSGMVARLSEASEEPREHPALPGIPAVGPKQYTGIVVTIPVAMAESFASREFFPRAALRPVMKGAALLHYEAEGLPPQKAGRVLWVAGMIIPHAAGRDDVIAPDTFNGAIRNPAGQVEAVTRIVVAAPAPASDPDREFKLKRLRRALAYNRGQRVLYEDGAEPFALYSEMQDLEREIAALEAKS